MNPGRPGTTYIYAHARRGMFLPLLNKSKINNGTGMIGLKVNVYTADKKLHVYKINIVKRHASDLSLAYNLKKGTHPLIMQTSEGSARSPSCRWRPSRSASTLPVPRLRCRLRAR